MQVKDEADVIESAVRRWFWLGCERILAFDDGSADGTREILDGLLRKAYLPVSTFFDDTEPYQMQKHVNKLSRAYIKYYGQGAEWIIPADADEIWHFPNNDPGAFFASLPQTPSWGEVPYYDNFPNGVRRLHTHKKCFGYLTEEMEISIGNHMILEGHKWPKIENHGIYIEHYPVRSYEQMKRKLINHMEAYKEQHPEHAHAQNWHLWQEMGEAFFEMKWKEFNPT